jgi:hypothetical protein
MEKKYDAQFRSVFELIRKLMSPDSPPKRPIVFLPEKRGKHDCGVIIDHRGNQGSSNAVW